MCGKGRQGQCVYKGVCAGVHNVHQGCVSQTVQIRQMWRGWGGREGVKGGQSAMRGGVCWCGVGVWGVGVGRCKGWGAGWGGGVRVRAKCQR